MVGLDHSAQAQRDLDSLTVASSASAEIALGEEVCDSTLASCCRVGLRADLQRCSRAACTAHSRAPVQLRVGAASVLTYPSATSAVMAASPSVFRQHTKGKQHIAQNLSLSM